MWGNQVKVVTIVVVGLVAATLSSCIPSKEKFVALQTAMQGSPRFAAYEIKDCIAKAGKYPGSEKAALIMNVPKSQGPSAFCKRLANALIDGRLTYEDVKASQRTPTPKVIKILQGR